MATSGPTSVTSELCVQKSDGNFERQSQTKPCALSKVCSLPVRTGLIKTVFRKGLQLLHFVVAMAYVLAGSVEFIRNRVSLDAYGDAKSFAELPLGIFESTLRLMDLPIILLLLGYLGVCLWLRFEGLSWLLTFSLSLGFLAFWTVNVWLEGFFCWKFYTKRMRGLELQVSLLAFCGTNVFMVLFFKRKKMPFKFKSSLPIPPLGKLHVAFNFCVIYIIQFTSMLLWFTKMYVSWACFTSHDDLLQLCQVSSQVQCYPCLQCSHAQMKTCYEEHKKDLFTCGASFPENAKLGSFCIFNYSMSLVQFLTIFAYIGGLCVFLSTFLRMVGHYVLRAVFKLHEWLNAVFHRSTRTLGAHKKRLHIRSSISNPRRGSLEAVINSDELACVREMTEPVADSESGACMVVDGRRISQLVVEINDEERNHGDWYNASCG